MPLTIEGRQCHDVPKCRARDSPPDARYQQQVLARFINKVMERGKKGIAERIVYDALESIAGPHRSQPARSLRAGAAATRRRSSK